MCSEQPSITARTRSPARDFCAVVALSADVQLELARLFSKQTSNAESARLVKAMRVSPVISFGSP